MQIDCSSLAIIIEQVDSKISSENNNNIRKDKKKKIRG